MRGGGGGGGELVGVRRGRGEKGVEGMVGFLKAIGIIVENRDKKHLSLSKLSLSALPGLLFNSLPHLTSLDLSKNCLTRVPSFLARLSHLRSIDLRGNPLTFVPSIPKSIPLKKFIAFVDFIFFFFVCLCLFFFIFLNLFLFSLLSSI